MPTTVAGVPEASAGMEKLPTILPFRLRTSSSAAYLVTHTWGCLTRSAIWDSASGASCRPRSPRKILALLVPRQKTCAGDRRIGRREAGARSRHLAVAPLSRAGSCIPLLGLAHELTGIILAASRFDRKVPSTLFIRPRLRRTPRSLLHLVENVESNVDVGIARELSEDFDPLGHRRIEFAREGTTAGGDDRGGCVGLWTSSPTLAAPSEASRDPPVQRSRVRSPSRRHGRCRTVPRPQYPPRSSVLRSKPGVCSRCASAYASPSVGGDAVAREP